MHGSVPTKHRRCDGARAALAARGVVVVGGSGARSLAATGEQRRQGRDDGGLDSARRADAAMAKRGREPAGESMWEALNAAEGRKPKNRWSEAGGARDGV